MKTTEVLYTRNFTIFDKRYFLQYITFSGGRKGVCKERLRGYSISAQTFWEDSTQ